MRKHIKNLLGSDLSSLSIAKKTGVHQSPIHRLRKGERTIDNLSFKNAEKLYKYAKAHLNE